MKNFLKKHGKKVSVGLLATAMMVTPFLPVVKAADSDTCKIRYNYFFLESENGWIDSIYSTSNDVDKSHSVVQTAYTTQYAMHFGWSQTDTSYTFDDYNEKLITDDGNIAKSIGAYFASGDEDTDNPLLHYYSYDPTASTKNFPAAYQWKLYNPSTKSTTDGDGHTSYAKRNDVSLVSTAHFYNYEIPAGFKKVGESLKHSWTDDELNIYAKMNVEKIKVGTPAASDLRYADGEDIYFVHYNWTNNTSGSTPDYYRSIDEDELKDSDTTGSLDTLFSDWATNKVDVDGSYAQGVLSDLQKSFITISDTTPIAKSGSVDIGDMKDASFPLTITRKYGSLSKPTAFWQTNSATKKSGDYYVTDYYHLYFFPALYTVTFEGPSDYCNEIIDEEITTEEKSNESSPNTGIISYAVIGTLLTGAASAYIYARKNNKFNRV